MTMRTHFISVAVMGVDTEYGAYEPAGLLGPEDRPVGISRKAGPVSAVLAPAEIVGGAVGIDASFNRTAGRGRGASAMTMPAWSSLLRRRRRTTALPPLLPTARKYPMLLILKRDDTGLRPIIGRTKANFGRGGRV